MKRCVRILLYILTIINHLKQAQRASWLNLQTRLEISFSWSVYLKFSRLHIYVHYLSQAGYFPRDFLTPRGFSCNRPKGMADWSQIRKAFWVFFIVFRRYTSLLAPQQWRKKILNWSEKMLKSGNASRSTRNWGGLLEVVKFDPLAISAILTGRSRSGHQHQWMEFQALVSKHPQVTGTSWCNGDTGRKLPAKIVSTPFPTLISPGTRLRK